MVTTEPTGAPAETGEPCPLCLEARRKGFIRTEAIQPLPALAPPHSTEGNRPCCHDCQAADTLLRVLERQGDRIGAYARSKAEALAPKHDRTAWLMMRCVVGNDRQEQYRVPGAPLGMVYFGLVRESAPGDLERHHAWLQAHHLEGEDD